MAGQIGGSAQHFFARDARRGRVMKRKKNFLVLLLLVMVIVGVVVTHIGAHLRFVLEHCLASVLPMLRQ
jgi:hypothetical protein